ncbi:MAG: hypothetical protein IMZ59_02110 [Actinobacteria bacterium]|nr:hypothetical protein [Actinomycetota bacterium]
MKGVIVQLDSNKKMGFIEDSRDRRRYPFEIPSTDLIVYKLYDKVCFDLDNKDSSWMFCINVKKIDK